MHTWVLNMNTGRAIQAIVCLHRRCVLYLCLHVGDELFSDIYKMKLIGDVLYEVEGKVSKQYQYDAMCRR